MMIWLGLNGLSKIDLKVKLGIEFVGGQNGINSSGIHATTCEENENKSDAI
jgi:hypothetical protein